MDTADRALAKQHLGQPANSFHLKKGMVFSPRVIKGIWNTLRWKDVFRDNPDAPTEAAFLAHYAPLNADPGFPWSDQAKGLTYLYDLSINQAQVVPAIDPYARRIKEANHHLWRFLPPNLLEEPADWRILWFKAANAGDEKTISFILEQDLDVNAFLQPADWAKTWFLAAGFARIEIMRLLLSRGFDINALDQRGESALHYVTGLYGGIYEAVVFLVEAGIKLAAVEEIIEIGSKSVTSAGEANEQTRIAAYLRRKAHQL